MTITSQGLSITEKAAYDNIKKKFQKLSKAKRKTLANKQASIVRRAIAARAGVETLIKGDIASMTLSEIINSNPFDTYL